MNIIIIVNALTMCFDIYPPYEPRAAESGPSGPWLDWGRRQTEVKQSGDEGGALISPQREQPQILFTFLAVHVAHFPVGQAVRRCLNQAILIDFIVIDSVPDKHPEGNAMSGSKNIRRCIYIIIYNISGMTE